MGKEGGEIERLYGACPRSFYRISSRKFFTGIGSQYWVGADIGIATLVPPGQPPSTLAAFASPFLALPGPGEGAGFLLG